MCEHKDKGLAKDFAFIVFWEVKQQTIPFPFRHPADCPCSSRPEEFLLDLDFWTSGARKFGLLDFWTLDLVSAG